MTTDTRDVLGHAMSTETAMGEAYPACPDPSRAAAEWLNDPDKCFEPLASPKKRPLNRVVRGRSLSSADKPPRVRRWCITQARVG